MFCELSDFSLVGAVLLQPEAQLPAINNSLFLYDNNCYCLPAVKRTYPANFEPHRHLFLFLLSLFFQWLNEWTVSKIDFAAKMLIFAPSRWRKYDQQRREAMTANTLSRSTAKRLGYKRNGLLLSSIRHEAVSITNIWRRTLGKSELHSNRNYLKLMSLEMEKDKKNINGE